MAPGGLQISSPNQFGDHFAGSYPEGGLNRTRSLEDWRCPYRPPGYLSRRGSTATFRTPRLHRTGARPVQGVLSRLITRTRISSDREGCRVGVAQLDCARLYSDDDFEPSQRQPSVQLALCGAARCASPVDTQVRLLSKLLWRQHHTLQTTQQSVTIETRRPIVGGRYETY